MQLQLERLDQAAKPGSRSRWCKSSSPSTTRRPSGRGRDPLAQRPGLGHARVPLGQAYGMPICSAACSPRGRSPWRYLRPLAPISFSRPTSRRALGARRPALPAARVFPHSARASGPAIRTRCGSPSTATPCCSPTKPSASTSRAGSTPSRRTSASHSATPLASRPVPAAAAGAAAAAARAGARPWASAPRSSPRAARRRTSERSAR